MTDSTVNATPPKSTKSKHSDSSVQIQPCPKSEFEFVPPDTKESEFLGLVDFRDAAFLVETTTLDIHVYPHMYNRM